MGQAKRRGTFEQRYQQFNDRLTERNMAINSKPIRPRRNMNSAAMLLTIASIAGGLNNITRRD